MECRLTARCAAAVMVLAGLGGGALASQTAVHVDNAWLKTDTAAKTAEFTLVAGLTGSNGGMNFNGAGNGTLTLTVPVGWKVVLHFRNDDQVLPHSAEVITEVAPVPVGAAPVAFEHAATKNATQGLPAGGKDDVHFVVDRVGKFLVFCAVPGHGAAGMWIRLDVSPGAGVPVLTATPKGS